MPKVLIIVFWSILQTFDGWNTLQKLELHKTYDEFLGEDIELPVFSDELKTYDGSRVTIEGYTIPLQQSAEQDYFVLSRFPYNNCFFCGNAGPETVVEVYTREKVPYRDVKVKVTGILTLNESDPLHLFFIISDAEVIRL